MVVVKEISATPRRWNDSRNSSKRLLQDVPTHSSRNSAFCYSKSLTEIVIVVREVVDQEQVERGRSPAHVRVKGGAGALHVADARRLKGGKVAVQASAAAHVAVKDADVDAANQATGLAARLSNKRQRSKQMSDVTYPSR